MILPLRVDKTAAGDIVKSVDINETGYYFNVEYQLTIIPMAEGLSINYYGDDDTYLNDEEVGIVISMAIENKL